MGISWISLLGGMIIGVLIEWAYWIVKCSKKGLFNENGTLKNLKKIKGDET